MFKFWNKLFKKNSNIEIKEITSNILEIKNRVYNIKHIIHFEKRNRDNSNQNKYGLIIVTLVESKEYYFETEKERNKIYEKLKHNLDCK